MERTYLSCCLQIRWLWGFNQLKAMGLTRHTNICGREIPPPPQHSLTGTGAFITHWGRVWWLKNLYRTDNRRHWCDFGELLVGGSLLSEAALTALVSGGGHAYTNGKWISQSSPNFNSTQSHSLICLATGSKCFICSLELSGHVYEENKVHVIASCLKVFQVGVLKLVELQSKRM